MNDVTSIPELSLQLISSAFQRCRASADLCRLTVTLRRSPLSNLVRISVSDTGLGSCMEEFGALKISWEAFGAGVWDGLLSVISTGFDDDVIHRYELNLREAVLERRMTCLPSNPKNGQKFSGTEVSLSMFESFDVLVGEVTSFFHKILVLKVPNVIFQLVADPGDVSGSQYENVFLVNEWRALPFSASNFERIKSGLEEYVFRHRNSLGKKCESCFSNRDHLNVGAGLACHTKSRRYSESTMEAVIVISEISNLDGTCIRTCGSNSEALASIDWKSYGLNFGGVVEQGGFALLKWENLPPNVQVDISLHHYHNQDELDLRTKMQPDGNLARKALKLALSDLKEKNAGVVLSTHAVKVRNCAPDLAKTISSLIHCSNDSSFREECCSLLGLPSQGVGSELVEQRIKEKIVAVIEMSDKEPHKSKEDPSYLFDDKECQDEEYGGEDAMDI